MKVSINPTSEVWPEIVEFLFDNPEKVNTIIFWEFDHREIANTLGIPFHSYIQENTSYFSEFLSQIDSVAYVGSFKMKTDFLLTLFLNTNIPIELEQSRSFQEITELERYYVDQLQSVLSITELFQEIYIFSISVLNKKYILICCEKPMDTFLTVSMLEIHSDAILWEKQFKQQPMIIWCPEFYSKTSSLVNELE